MPAVMLYPATMQLSEHFVAPGPAQGGGASPVNRRGLIRVLWLGAWVAPSVLVACLIAAFGVDVPLWDQWDATFPLFQKCADGTLGPGDFLHRHNEHCIFFPKLLMYGLGRLTHWNIWAEMAVTWLLAWAGLLALWRLARVTAGNLFQNGPAVLCTGLLIFTPLGVENWLFGFQIGLLLPLACFTLGLATGGTTRYPWNFLMTTALGVICTMSIASGFTCWLLFAPLLCLPDLRFNWRQTKAGWLIFAAGFIASTLVAFHGEAGSGAIPVAPRTFAHPLQCAVFFLAFLGSPFGQGTPFDPVAVSAIAGFLLAAGFVCATAYFWCWRRDRGLLKRALPWLMCAGIAFGHAVLITIGRSGLGMDQAIVSRYVVFCVPLSVSLVFLAPMACRHWASRGAASQPFYRGAGMGLSALAGGFAVLYLLGNLVCLGEWRARQHIGLAAKAAVTFINVIDDPVWMAGNVEISPETTRPKANALDRWSYLRPALVRSKNLQSIASVNPVPGDRYGAIQQSGSAGSGRFGLIGWAALPERNRPADAVLLTCDSPAGEPLVFSVAVVGLQQTEVPARIKASGLAETGWGKEFPTAILPPGRQILRAWAFDFKTGRAYALQGAAVLVH